jgi:hypothetical protein
MPALAVAQGKAPAPAFSVEMNFQSFMARQLAERCEALEFDHAGFDRHMRSLIAKFSDRGIPARTQGKHFAPIDPQRYAPYFAAFSQKYELTENSSDQAFCDAGMAAAEWRTPIGRMLKGVAE